MPIVLVEQDPFSDVADPSAATQGADGTNVRRPLYGIEVKEPRFAFLSLLQDLGEGAGPQEISLIDSSAPGGYSNANHNFILQSVSESRTEKTQIVETFGDHFVFFYGQSPIVLQVQGMLLNTKDFNWKNEILANYDRYLRGTRCVENRTRAYLGWDDALAQGYILNIQISYSADNPLLIPFSFSMLLSKPPTDLSAAAAVMDNPKRSSVPWTYRSTALAGEDVFMPEYLTPIASTEYTQILPVPPVDRDTTTVQPLAPEAKRRTKPKAPVDPTKGVPPGVTTTENIDQSVLVVGSEDGKYWADAAGVIHGGAALVGSAVANTVTGGLAGIATATFGVVNKL